MIRYVVHPDYVRSRTDGDRHWVSARDLMHLYGVSLWECLVADVNTLPGRQAAQREDLVHLYPRHDGNYSLGAR